MYGIDFLFPSAGPSTFFTPFGLVNPSSKGVSIQPKECILHRGEERWRGKKKSKEKRREKVANIEVEVKWVKDEGRCEMGE